MHPVVDDYGMLKKERQQQRRRRRLSANTNQRCILRIVLPALSLLVFLYLLILILVLHRMEDDEALQSPLPEESQPQEATAASFPSVIPPCTFDDLLASFPGRGGASHRQPTTTSENASCWKLQDEILRIPISHIQSLTPVGHGRLGSVHRAVLELPLPSQQQNTKDYLCVAAIKTDSCPADSCIRRVRQWFFSWLVEPWLFGTALFRRRRREEAQRLLSCRPKEGVSYLGAEYTGALLWYAQYKSNTYHPGLLPTWAVLVDDDDAATVDNDHHYNSETNRRFRGYPHPDPTIRGVLMPLDAFTPASDLISESCLILNVSQLAQIILPAAMGLEFAGSLGLAFRDLLEKNVGIRLHDDQQDFSSLIYDNSYMGYQPPDVCESVACRFCREDVFAEFDDYYHRVIKGIRKDQPYILGDMHNFRNVIIRLSEALCHQVDASRAHQFEYDVFHTLDVHHLIQVLQNYSLPPAKGVVS